MVGIEEHLTTCPGRALMNPVVLEMKRKRGWQIVWSTNWILGIGGRQYQNDYENNDQEKGFMVKENSRK